MSRPVIREPKDTDAILLSDGDGFRSFEIRMTEDREFYDYIYQAHSGLIETKIIKKIENQLFYSSHLKNAISYFDSIKNHILYPTLAKLERLEYKDSVGRIPSNGTDITILCKLNNNRALDFVNPLEKILVEKLTKKIYVKNGRVYLPTIIPTIVTFLLGRETQFGKIVTNPSLIELTDGDKMNIADGAIDVEFFKHISKYVGLKDSTLLQMIESFSPKPQQQRAFKAKKRRRR